MPIERITTRTARLAMPTLHSTPSASARARGEEVQREPGQRDGVRRQARLDQPVAHDLAASAGAHRGQRPARGRALRAPPAARGAGRLGHQAVWALGAKAQAAGRARASHVATYPAMPAVTAPRNASERKWLAVETITKVTSSGYSVHAMRVTRCLQRRPSGTPIMSAKQTCIDGTAA